MPSKQDLLPLLVASFAELGYRRSTTAALARRCKVQEPALYRLWPDKKAMFVAAIDHVADNNLAIYRRVLEEAGPADNPALFLLQYEAKHIGEFRNHRIVFAALPEAGDPAIRAALQRLYHRIHAFVAATVARSGRAISPDAAMRVAWGLIGLGTVMTIVDELDLMGGEEREAVMRGVGSAMLDMTDSIH